MSDFFDDIPVAPTPPKAADPSVLGDYYARKHGVDPQLVQRVMKQESRGKQFAKSPVGASGYMQLMPDTARSLGVKDIYDPHQNIDAGVRYLKKQLDDFGDVNLALAAYNAGPGAVKKYGNRVPPYRETQNYVKTIGGGYTGNGLTQSQSAPSFFSDVPAVPQKADSFFGDVPSVKTPAPTPPSQGEAVGANPPTAAGPREPATPAAAPQLTTLPPRATMEDVEAYQQALEARSRELPSLKPGGLRLSGLRESANVEDIRPPGLVEERVKVGASPLTQRDRYAVARHLEQQMTGPQVEAMARALRDGGEPAGIDAESLRIFHLLRQEMKERPEQFAAYLDNENFGERLSAAFDPLYGQDAQAGEDVVRTVVPPPPQKRPDIYTTTGRAQRDLRQQAETQGGALYRVPVGSGATPDAVKQAVGTIAKETNVPAEFVDKWLREHTQGVGLYEQGTQRELQSSPTGYAAIPTEMIGQMKRDYSASLSLPSRAVRNVSEVLSTQTPGEMLLGTARELKKPITADPVTLTEADRAELANSKRLTNEGQMGGEYERALVQPFEAFSAGLGTTAGNLVNVLGRNLGINAVRDIGAYLQRRGEITQRKSQLRPEGEVPSLGPEIARYATGAGLSIAELVLLKRASGLPLPIIMAGESIARDMDKPAEVRAQNAVTAFGSGLLLDKTGALGRLPAAIAQTGLDVGQGVLAGDSAATIAAKGVGGAILGGAMGGGEHEAMREAIKPEGDPRVLGDLTRRSVPESTLASLPDIPIRTPEGVRVVKRTVEPGASEAVPTPERAATGQEAQAAPVTDPRYDAYRTATKEADAAISRKREAADRAMQTRTPEDLDAATRAEREATVALDKLHRSIADIVLDPSAEIPKGEANLEKNATERGREHFAEAYPDIAGKYAHEPVRHVDLQKRDEAGQFREETPRERSARLRRVNEVSGLSAQEGATQRQPDGPRAGGANLPDTRQVESTGGAPAVVGGRPIDAAGGGGGVPVGEAGTLVERPVGRAGDAAEGYGDGSNRTLRLMPSTGDFRADNTKYLTEILPEEFDVYREVKVRPGQEVNLAEPGKSWAETRAGAVGYATVPGESVILKARVKRSDIDVGETLRSRARYGEPEINFKPGTKLGVQIVERGGKPATQVEAPTTQVAVPDRLNAPVPRRTPQEFANEIIRLPDGALATRAGAEGRLRASGMSPSGAITYAETAQRLGDYDPRRGYEPIEKHLAGQTRPPEEVISRIGDAIDAAEAVGETPARPSLNPSSRVAIPAAEGGLIRPRTAQRSFPQSAEAAGLSKGTNLTYEVQADAPAVERASARIEAQGADKVAADIARNREPSKDDVVAAQLLAKRYSEAGDHEREVAVINDLAEKLTKAGQSVQAASLISRLSPEGVLIQGQRILNKRRANRILTAEEVAALKETAGRVREYEAKVTDLQRQIEEMRLRPQRAARPKLETFEERLGRLESDARARLEARKAQAQAVIAQNGQAGATSIIPDLADYAVIGAVKLAKRGVTLARWTDEMVSEFGDEIKPHLRAIYQQSYAQLKTEREVARREAQERAARRDVPGPMRPEDVRRLVAERTQAQKDAQRARGDLERTFRSLSRTGTQKALDAATSFRRANLLTAARTHLRNVTSNALFQGTEELSRPLAAIGDMMAKRKTGMRTTRGLNLMDAARATIQAAITEGPARAKAIMLGREVLPLEGYRPGAESMGSKMQLHESETGSKILDAYVNTVYRSLEAEDAVFKVYAFRRELADIARSQAEAEKAKDSSVNVRERTRELQQNPTDAMLTEASAYADYATFQNKNAVSETIAGAKRTLTEKAGPLPKFAIESIAPFDRTPTNIIARTIENSPAGFISAAMKYRRIGKRAAAEQLAGRVADEAFTRAEQKDFARTFGRASTGTILSVLGMALAHKGLLSGASDYDTDKKDYMEKRRKFGGGGMLKIPGTNQYVSIADTPVGKAMATAAAIYEQMTKHTDREKGDYTFDERLTGAGKAALNVLTDQPLIRGLRDMAGSASVGEGLGNYGASYVPGEAALKAGAEVLDPQARISRGQGIASPFRMLLPPQVPGGRGELPVDTGIDTGERGGVGRRVLRGLDPFNTTTEGKGPQKREKSGRGSSRPSRPARASR